MPMTNYKGISTMGQILHCQRTAGACIKDHQEEKEGGNIKQHMRMQQQGIRVLCMIILPKLQMGPVEFVEKYNVFQRFAFPNT